MSAGSHGADALKGADVESGDEPGTPVHSPTIPDDEGNPVTAPGRGTPVRRAARPRPTATRTS
jgi:hypothetical protein